MSGATIGGVVGGVIGAFFGPVGAQIGYIAGSLIGGYVDPETIKGPSLGEMPIQTSQEGVPRPIPFGSPPPFQGNIIQIGPKVFTTKRERQGSGKGGGPVVESQEVYQSYLIRVCQGPATILTVWRDGKVVYDATGTFPVDADGAAFMSRTRFYTGDEDQMPDPTFEALVGSGNQPAYRGTCHMVVTGDNLTPTNGRIPVFDFRVAEVATVTNNCQDDMFFWFPLDEDNPGSEGSREVINGWDGVDSGTTAGPMLTVNTDGSTHFGHGDYVLADQPQQTFDIGHGEEAWSLMAVARPTGTPTSSVTQCVAADIGDAQTGLVNWGFFFRGANLLTPQFVMTLNAFGGTQTITAANEVGIGDIVVFIARWVQDPGAGPYHGTLEFWVDGELQGTIVGANGDAWSGNYVSIGGNHLYPNSYSFNGDVTDVRGWRRALTDAEIQNFSALSVPDDYAEAPDAPGTFIHVVNGSTYTRCGDSAVQGTTYLADVERRLCRMAGVQATDLDVAEDEDVVVHGFLVNRPMPAAEAMRVLGGAYYRDFPEYDLQIHSIPRGGPSVVTLTDDNWVDTREDLEVRAQHPDLPRKVLMYFSDPDAAYAMVPVPAERTSINVTSEGIRTIELPMVFPRDEVKKIAEVYLKVLWEEQQGSKLVRELPAFEFAYLTPADPITYNQQRWRIVQLVQKETTIQIECVRDRISNYQSTLTANPLEPMQPPVVNLKGPTTLRILQIPPLRPDDYHPGVYAAVTGHTAGWPGADLYMRVGDGDWIRLTRMTASASMGRLTADLEVTSNGITEPLQVQMFDGATLVSATAAQIANGANAFAITSGGVSDIGQFETATDDSAGEYLLTDLTLGLLETNQTSHSRGDNFTILDTNLYYIPIDPGYAGMDIEFAAATLGTPVENAQIVSINYDPVTFVTDGGEVVP